MTVTSVCGCDAGEVFSTSYLEPALVVVVLVCCCRQDLAVKYC